jgi:valine--pyruvate aminotransferase
VCFSRPTNPSGNVFTDSEVQKVVDMAKKHNAVVLIDSAYSAPFPNLSFVEMTPFFGDNVLHIMSFSKAGIPGERV